MDKLQFVIPCHNTIESNYIERCVKNIRSIYGNNVDIHIINDDSPLKLPKDLDAYIIESEFKGVGEFLAYYYYI